MSGELNSNFENPLCLLVHIGSHKAGSTSIQDAAYLEAEKLLAAGVVFPVRRPYYKNDQHSQIAQSIQVGNWRRVERFLEKARQEAVRMEAGMVFLSGEEFWTLSPRKVAKFSKICQNYFGEISFIFVTRDDRERLYSNFKHFLRHSKARTLDTFVQETARIFIPGQKIWAEQFSNCFLEINFEEVKRNFVPAFFKAAFGIQTDINPKSNSSMDFLSLVVNNVFIKDWKNQDTENVLWTYFQDNQNAVNFPIETQMREDLYSKVFELSSRSANSLSATPAPEYDPVEICNRMIALFQGLRRTFLARNCDADQTKSAE